MRRYDTYKTRTENTGKKKGKRISKQKANRIQAIYIYIYIQLEAKIQYNNKTKKGK